MMTACLCRRRLSFLLSAVLAALIALTGCGSLSASGLEKEDKTFKWFYDSLSDAQKAAYDAFETASDDPFDGGPVPLTDVAGQETEIPVSELDMVYQAFLYDHPEIFWLGKSYNYRVSVKEEEMADAVSVIPIPDSEEELSRERREFESAAQSILERAKGAKDDRERVLVLYNCLTEEIEYEEEALYNSALEYEHTAYGAIAGRRAVCDGIALAYKYLLDQSGIKCILIPGLSGETPHVWNTVFWDGSWHEADPTWDAASEESSRGQYFDLTTEEMNKDHEREKEGIALGIPDAQ